MKGMAGAVLRGMHAGWCYGGGRKPDGERILRAGAAGGRDIGYETLIGTAATEAIPVDADRGRRGREDDCG